jgi:thymidylate synthase (FAD)
LTGHPKYGIIYRVRNNKKSKQNSRVEASSPERKADGTFLPGTHWRPRKPHWDKAWLLNEYVTKKRSAGEIASDAGCTENNILFWLGKHGIKCRSMSEVRKIKKWALKGKANGMHGRCGCKNPRWIDGSSPLRQAMYARSFWKELAKAVYERDGYKCRRCGYPKSHGRPLHAHHVKPWAGNADSRFCLSNIITLCKTCHRWVHSKENESNEFLSH